MSDLVFVGAGIILAGVLIVFLATVMSGRSSEPREGRTEVKGGGVVMIGPIPIVFGSDAKWATLAMAVAIALIVIALLSGALAGR